MAKAPEPPRKYGFGSSSRKFIEPPLVTTHQCKAYKEGTAKELLHANAAANRTIEGAAKTLRRNNSYFGYFRNPTTDISFEHKFTYDQVKDTTVYEPKIPRDCFHKDHTEANRRRIGHKLETQWQIRSSQSYGWLPPIDEPKMGFGRSSIFLDSAMDKSHLRVGG